MAVARPPRNAVGFDGAPRRAAGRRQAVGTGPVITWAVTADAGDAQGAVLTRFSSGARWQAVDHLGGPAERPHPIGRFGGPLQLERDLPQRVNCLHG